MKSDELPYEYLDSDGSPDTFITDFQDLAVFERVV